MKRLLFFALIFSGVLSGTAAFSHSAPEFDPGHQCTSYRPNGAVPDGHPVEAKKDAEDNNFVGVCTSYGVVRVGTNESGIWAAADGNSRADIGPEEAPAQTHWTDGYVLLTTDEQGNLHGYCAGGGQYEDGDQPDDEFMTGDCGATGASE